MSTRSIHIPVAAHTVIELLAAPLLMVAPFVLGFGLLSGAITLALGMLMMSLAISAASEQRTIPLSAHVGFDYAIATVTIFTGLAVGMLHRRGDRNSLFGRVRRRPYGADRSDAVQCPRCMRGPTYLPQIHICRDEYLSSL